MLNNTSSTRLIEYWPKNFVSVAYTVCGNYEVSAYFKCNKQAYQSFFFFKNSTLFRLMCCSDIVAVDKIKLSSRYKLTYCLLSLTFNRRLSLLVELDGVNNFIASSSNIFPSSNWSEREIFDMFGIIFTSHPNLSRILTDYGFKGNPMLKKFPCIGTYQIHFSPYMSRIRYVKLKNI